MAETDQEQPSSIDVLYVEDDPQLPELVEMKLERLDDRISLVTENRAKDGLRVLEDTSIDCIISDYQMPAMDGLEFLEAVRETYPSLPFILYTGKGSEDIAANAINAGVDAYVQKGRNRGQFSILAKHIDTLVDKYQVEQRLESIERNTHIEVTEDADSETATPQLEPSPSIQVIRAVAKREGVDPVYLDPPLFEAIDPTALDSFVSGVEARENDTPASVTFEYKGYHVMVEGNEVSLETSECC